MNDRSQIDTRTSGSAATPMAEGGALVRPPTDETCEEYAEGFLAVPRGPRSTGGHGCPLVRLVPWWSSLTASVSTPGAMRTSLGGLPWPASPLTLLTTAVTASPRDRER